MTIASTAGRRHGFAKSFLLHTRSEFVDFWMSVISLAFIVLMPVMFYVVFGVAFLSAADSIRSVNGAEIRQADLSYAGVLTFASMSVTFANVAIGLAIRREHGLFRRFRTTPVPPWVVMGAFLVNIFVTLVIVLAVVSAIGFLGLRVTMDPDRVVPLLVTAVLGFIALSPIGVALSLLPPNADAAVPIVNGIFFPLAFLSGAFITVPLGAFVDAIVPYLPGAPLFQLFAAVFSEGAFVWDGRQVLILLGWAVIGIVLSGAFFRWASEREPRGFTRRKSAE